VIYTSAFSQEKDRSSSLIGKAYQDLTTHYNYYFNSRLDFNENLKMLSDGNKDNYNEILSIEEIGDAEYRKQGASFDNVIKKTSLAITLHDNSKWADDCYILMAKSQYMKGDYNTGIETFQYIINEFSDKKRLRPKKDKGGKSKYKKSPSKSKSSSSSSKPSAKEYNKQKKKASKGSSKKSAKDYNKEKKKAAKERAKSASSKDEEEEVYEEIEEKIEDTTEVDESDSEKKKGKRQIFGHKKVNYESLVWLAKSYVEIEEYTRAKEVLSSLEEDESFPKRLMDDLYLVKATSALKRENYSEARKELANTIEFTRKRSKRARYYYIIGQLAQKAGNYAEASDAFKNVRKMKPTYLMEFNARLNQVLSQSFASGNNSSAISELNKMIKDGKNKDYLDQIHYKLAEIHAVNGDTEAMISSLRMAAANGDPTGDQLSETYLKLAEVFYEQEKFKPSSSYYDSTLVVIKPEHSRYDEVVKRQAILAELVSHLNVIEKQDSLQKLAKMPNVLRNEIIDEIIAEFEANASEGSDNKSEVDFKDFADNNIDPRAGRANRPGLGSTASAGGSFHFYNQAAKARGFSKFKETWGDRTLSDNWRVSSLSSAIAVSFGEVDESIEEILDLASQGNLTRDFFIKQLPDTPEKVQASNSKIATALFYAGGVYKDKLYNEKKAIDTYSSLNSRFSKNKHKLDALYQLYLLYDRAGNTSKANKTKKIILSQYKNSIYAKLISDPSYAGELAAANAEANTYYEQTYALYSNGQYNKVKSRLSKASEMFKENPFQAKYDMLNALAIGETEDEETFASALNNVISLHPEDPVKNRAEEILALLGVPAEGASAGKSTLKSAEYDPKTSPFKPSMETKHYFIISFAEFNSKINSLIDQLVILNDENFELEGLKVNQMLLDQKNQLVVVKTFSKGEKALDYYKALKKDERTYFEGVKGSEFYFFPISKTNFTTYFKDKDPAAYMGFFEAEYLKK